MGWRVLGRTAKCGALRNKKKRRGQRGWVKWGYGESTSLNYILKKKNPSKTKSDITWSKNNVN